MATAVLRSEDFLKGRYHLDAFAPRPPPSTANPSRKKSHPHHRSSHPLPSKSGRLSNPPSPPSRSPSPKAAAPRPNRRSPPPPAIGAAAGPKNALMMESVKILKRGEDPYAVAAESAVDCRDSALCTINWLGPEPEILPKKLGFVDLSTVYAGPAFFASPSPSALPIPGFLARTEATRAVRCVLRLI